MAQVDLFQMLGITPAKEEKKEIEKAQKICVFTGAGISCPSGIPDFRSADGLYNEKGDCEYSPEEMISHTFFVRNTNLFYDFYKHLELNYYLHHILPIGCFRNPNALCRESVALHQIPIGLTID